MVTFHQFFVRKNAGIISLNDFKSKSDIRIVIQNHQVLTEYLKDLNSNQHPSYAESTREGLRMVSSGKYDAMLLPQRCGQYFIQKYYLENLVPVANTILPREYAVGIKQNDSLLVADINQGLSIIENTGKFSDIYSKWFSQYEEKSFYVKYIAWIIGLLLMSGVVIALILMWNSVLKKRVRQKTNELSLQLKQKEETERQLRIETARAQESDSLKSAFLANMSHEIRTPMNAIIGFSELLAEPDITDHDRAFYFELINANSYALLNLINDIIDVAKIESGQIVIVSNTFDINRLLFELFEVFQMSIKRNDKKKVKLECDPFYTASYDLFSDEMRLKQVLTNLIGNALKFTDKGFVKFGYDIIEGNLRFFVQDNGIGIPTNKQDVIFNRFRQADEGLARSFGGAGLGLYISKYIVELLGGKIWFESEELSGTTFYFTIPIRVAEPDHKEN
jgi:signal transduction histidine kinase